MIVDLAAWKRKRQAHRIARARECHGFTECMVRHVLVPAPRCLVPLGTHGPCAACPFFRKEEA